MPETCVTCGKDFSNRAELEKHYETDHTYFRTKMKL
jgi:hypothetical protein